MPGYREIVVGQGTQASVNYLAARLRQPKAVELKDEPEPERPALEALEKLTRDGTPPEGESAQEIAAGPLMFPDGLFASVQGREPEKRILEAAIKSSRPTHVLLVGDPASGKSELLQCCSRMPGTRYAVGGMTTSSGLVEYLLERRASTRLILIDELDKARDMSDYAMLYELMESGRAPVMMHGRTEELRWRGKIFAAANSTERIPDALRSRFTELHLRPYSPAELRSINRVIVEREGMSAERAAHIADRVAARSHDPRDAVKVARLAGPDGEVDTIIDQVTARKPA